MPPSESSLFAQTVRFRIIWLVGAQIVVGLLLGAITAATRPDPNLVGASFIGLVLSQTSLLGIWGGSGRNRWWIRFVGVVVGIGCLGPPFGICIREPQHDVVWLVAFATMIVLAPLLLARCFGFRTRQDSDKETPATKMQFSIRHLMILTLVVACWLALAKWQQLYLDLDDWPLMAAIAMPFAVVGLVAAWAVLGVKRLLISIPVLFSVAVGAGCGMAKLLGPASEFSIWITATLTEAMSLTVSLLVVRSCGFRLRRRAGPPTGSDPVEVI